jgi:DNA-binding IscR family transcriptional regulator
MAARTSTRILGILAGAQGLLSTKAIADCTGIDRTQVSKCCTTLVSRKLIAKVGIGRFEVTKSGREFLAQGRAVTSGPNGPLTGKPKPQGLRARAWRAMRYLEKFTVGELVEISIKGGEKQPHSNIRAYLRKLRAAGYVGLLQRRAAGTAVTSNGFNRYLLIRNTGPKAPVWRPDKGVLFDPNTGEEIDL